MNTAIVKNIQVGGVATVNSLEEMARVILSDDPIQVPMKISFAVQLPNSVVKYITIREEVHRLVAYGDFEGLQSFLEYAQETIAHDELSDVEPQHG